jgi:hypothetical protein
MMKKVVDQAEKQEYASKERMACRSVAIPSMVMV